MIWDIILLTIQKKVYNRKADLEAKRLKRLAVKNKQNYDNDDDENDGGNDDFEIK